MLKLLCATIFLTSYISLVTAGHIAGYHYEKPSVSIGLVDASLNLEDGHGFGPLPTIQPLPPVPALPPLPTPRVKGEYIQTRTVYQTHPVATLKSLPISYLPPGGSGIGKIAQQYQPPSLQPSLLAQQSTTASVKSVQTGTGFLAGLGSNIPNPPPPAAQPLRVPFGSKAVISFPSEVEGVTTYETHGRHLKQYAVVEIIDNDIEQNTQPFLNSPFIDNYRAQVGATGPGATPQPLGRIQFGSRSNSDFLGQQLTAYQAPPSDSVALGSGGLGFIRLANGNVYLGSGSLGYISGQQHTQEVIDARTRTGALQPDALHFGHGSLANTSRFNKYSYRFK